ncbi:response regulator [Paraburkholderia caribensis]|uniref:response regulator transcription factor n=1 Tax=Paraburkholderia TaxID=1822464 RepID=UPI001CC4BC66|nr:response regulator [Paraburkholderia caribensis]BEU24693.1 response regulator [Paraburkholderia sp. 22B1P]GJH32859.1 response regulator [Paraburkholderia hospita]
MGHARSRRADPPRTAFLYQGMVIGLFPADYSEFRKSNTPQRCRGFACGVSPRNPVNPAVLVSIVEDDELVRKATENLIRSMGWDVLAFDSADSFIASGAVYRTTCLISDVTMPGMSGIEMHALLISQGCAPPTIFITGYPNAQDEAIVLANGALAYLEKPVDANTMLAQVQLAIGAP